GDGGRACDAITGRSRRHNDEKQNHKGQEGDENLFKHNNSFPVESKMTIRRLDCRVNLFAECLRCPAVLCFVSACSPDFAVALLAMQSSLSSCSQRLLSCARIGR